MIYNYSRDKQLDSRQHFLIIPTAMPPLPPLPFTPPSSFGNALEQLWLDPLAALPSEASADAREAAALNAYSILRDRRIPAAFAAELDTAYNNKPKRLDSLLREFVKSAFTPASAPEHELPMFRRPENACNHLYGLTGKSGKPPLPSGDCFSMVRLSKWTMDALRTEWLDTDSRFKAMLGAALGAKLEPGASKWAWLYKIAQTAPGTAATDPRLALLIEMLNLFRCGGYKGGTYAKGDDCQWSAPAHEVQEHLQKAGSAAQLPADASPWLSALGMGHVAGEVVLIFKFPTARAGVLYRPNHLDAQFYKEHFPSPLSARVPWPSHPMHLADLAAPPLPHRLLVREFLHPPVPFRISDLFLVAITEEATNLSRIPAQRRHHWQRLARRYSSTDLPARLMPDHTGTERSSPLKSGPP